MNELLRQVAKEHDLPYELLAAIVAIEEDCLDLDAEASEAIPRLEELLTRKVGR